jgi:hypothetical protein
MPFSPPISSDKFPNMAVVDPVKIPGDLTGRKSLGIETSGRRGQSHIKQPGKSRGRAIRGSVATPASLRNVKRNIV